MEKSPIVEANRFVRPIPDDFICSICTNVLSYPNILEDSVGHCFCQSCITKWLAKEKTCPLDRSCLHETNLRPIGVVLKATIAKLSIVCKYKEFGCEHICTWEFLMQHEQNCRFRNKTCRHCNFKIDDENATHSCIKTLLNKIDHLNSENESLSTIKTKNEELMKINEKQSKQLIDNKKFILDLQFRIQDLETKTQRLQASKSSIELESVAPTKAAATNDENNNVTSKTYGFGKSFTGFRPFPKFANRECKSSADADNRCCFVCSSRDHLANRCPNRYFKSTTSKFTIQKDDDKREHKNGFKSAFAGFQRARDVTNEARSTSNSTGHQKIFNKWICKVCLLKNDDKRVSCECCTTLKEPMSKTETVTKTASSHITLAYSDKKWTCETCLFSNDDDETSCAWCTLPRGTTSTISSIGLGRGKIKKTEFGDYPNNRENVTKKWKCKACLFENSDIMPICGFCTSLKE